MKLRRRRVGFAAGLVAVIAVAFLTAPVSASTWRYEVLDGDGGTNGRVTKDVGTENAAIVWNDQPHVFYRDEFDKDLRHAWWTGTTWRFETLDGQIASGGRTVNDVGFDIAATVWNGEPHVFYYDETWDDLRHAWWNGTRWLFETLDGNSTVGGRVSGVVGDDVAVTVWNSQPHLWYFDGRPSVNDLRHAWWDGTRWQFETLDGNCPTPTCADGRTTSSVGLDNVAAVWNGTPHVWYRDDTAQDLRHAWWTGSAWRFETLDGNGAAPSGRISADVGYYGAVTVWNRTPHVWYLDATNFDLRHAWWTGTAWAFETLDGACSGPCTNGRVAGTVGFFNAVTVWNGTPHVWYQASLGPDDDDLRHAWWTGTAWNFETLDGDSTVGGRITGRTGFDNAVTVWNNEPHVFSYDATGANLRHAWYG